MCYKKTKRISIIIKIRSSLKSLGRLDLKISTKFFNVRRGRELTLCNKNESGWEANNCWEWLLE